MKLTLETKWKFHTCIPACLCLISILANKRILFHYKNKWNKLIIWTKHKCSHNNICVLCKTVAMLLGRHVILQHSVHLVDIKTNNWNRNYRLAILAYVNFKPTNELFKACNPIYRTPVNAQWWPVLLIMQSWDAIAAFCRKGRGRMQGDAYIYARHVSNTYT